MTSDPHPHVTAALAYCRDVVAGRIPAGKLVVRACERHLRDLERAAENSPDFPYFFDPVQAERVCKFGEMMPHVKGKWARKDPLNRRAHLIRLEPWQCFFLCSIFGWMQRGTEREFPNGRRTALRRFREVDLWVPRKNAKSTTACIIGLWMFAKDDEPGAEVYCGAGSEKQAWEVFGPSRQMCLSEPKLQSQLGIEVNARSLHATRAGSLSKFEPVIGKPGDGASPHCAIVDEYHEHDTSAQFDTFKTGMGAREQPLILVVSTAGSNQAGPAKDRWNEGRDILQGTITDERHFVLCYTVDDAENDWRTEHGLRAANPNWGVSVNATTMLADLEQALQDAKKQSNFKTKHLNLWVGASVQFFNLEFLRKCHERGTFAVEEMAGESCHMGADLATKINLAAVAKVFRTADDRYRIAVRYYAPEYFIQLPENQKFRNWHASGHIIATPGNVIDFNLIRDDMLDDCGKYRVEEVAVDPWQSGWLIGELTAKNVKAFEFRQTVQMMSEPMKQLDALMKEGRLEFDGNPVTDWCLGNVVAYVDKKENVYPNKDKPNSKQFIDGAIAILMAFARAYIAPQSQALPGVVTLDAW